MSETTACFKSRSNSAILKCMTVDIFSWHCTPWVYCTKWTIILQGEEKNIPVPKQRSTAILLIYPARDLPYRVLKAPCLCIVRGVSYLFYATETWAEWQLSAKLVSKAISLTFSKPIQLSHHLRTDPQLEVFSVAAASWDIWPPECIPLGLGKGFEGSRR